MKKCLMADPEFRLGEVDKSQSEARCTAYLSQDLDLIRALEDDIDFYVHTAKVFFGVDVDKDHPLRQLCKKIIHGTNYMMGVDTFIDEVGIKTIREAQVLLGKQRMPIKEFVAYLLGLYHKAYPRVPKWWDSTKLDIIKWHKITTPDGWTRLFFGDPRKDHKILRNAVAHQPQHLSVAGINKAMWHLLHLQLDSNGDYIMMAQIHDSIVFEAKEEKFDYYMEQTMNIMQSVDTVHGRTMVIPLEAEHGTHWKPMQEWSLNGRVV